MFDVVKLTEDEMVLNWAAPGAVIFDPGWATSSSMWMFVRK
jgi:hypothetical protein